MFNNSAFTMPVVPAGYSTGGNGGSGNGAFGGEGGWIWILVVFALLFGWGNNGNNGGGNNGGGSTQFIPYSVGGGCGYDAAVQRGFDQQSIISKLDGLTYGLSDSTYALNNSINSGFFGVQQTLCQGFNGVSREIADCCCKTQAELGDIKYQMATQACDTRHAISDSTRDIIDSQNAGTRAILDFLTTDKIASLQAENQSLRLAASQADQNAVLRAAIDASTAEIIRRTGNDCPIPAFVVQPSSPVSFPTNCCGQFTGYGNYGYNNSGCGCGCA